jgi:ribose transport system substrate-binding protein
MRKSTLWLWLSGLALAGLAACSKAAPAGKPVIAVIPKGTLHEFWKAIHAGADQAAQKLDVQIQWNGPQPEGDREAQIHLIQNFISAGVQGIVLAPIDERALQPVVAEAKAAGVPTVVIDSALAGDAHIAYIATDNKKGGELGGDHLAKLLGGKGKVILLRFQQGSASTMAREQGFLDAMARNPGITIVSQEQYAGDTEKARQAAESLLIAHPDADGVFCPNESTTHGFLLALQSSGKAGKVKFVGFDGSKPLVDGLKQGQLHGLVLQDPVTMGRRGVEAMVAHLRGQPVQRNQTTDLVLATPDNAKEPAVRNLLEPEASAGK